MLSRRLAPLIARIEPLALPALAGLFLVLYAFMGLAYLRSVSQQDSLREQSARLGSITTVAQARAKEVEAEFKAIQEGIPSAQLVEIDVFRAMRELATETGLDPAGVTIELRGVTARQRVGGTEYRVMSFGMTATGDYENVWALVQKLDRGETPFSTLVLDKASLTLEAKSNAAMDFKLYTRPPGQ